VDAERQLVPCAPQRDDCALSWSSPWIRRRSSYAAVAARACACLGEFIAGPFALDGERRETQRRERGDRDVELEAERAAPRAGLA